MTRVFVLKMLQVFFTLTMLENVGFKGVLLNFVNVYQVFYHSTKE